MLNWEVILDKGVTAFIAVFVIVRLEHSVRQLHAAIKELMIYVRGLNGH